MTAPLTQRSSTSPSLAEVLLEAIRSSLLELNTGLPGRVVKFYAETQSCDVQPLLLRVVQDEEGEERTERYPQITNVPVQYPAGGGWSIVFPLSEGDEVFLTFAQRSLDRWLESQAGQEVDPQHSRVMSVSDAVCVPGIRRRGGTLSNLQDLGDDLVIGRDGADPRVILRANGDVEIGSASGARAVVVRANGDVELGRGAAQKAVLGDLLTEAIKAHTHTDSMGGPTTTPLNSTVFDSTLSQTVKVGP